MKSQNVQELLTPKELRSAAVRFYRKAEFQSNKGDGEKMVEYLEKSKELFLDAGETDLAQKCQLLQEGVLKF